MAFSLVVPVERTGCERLRFKVSTRVNVLARRGCRARSLVHLVIVNVACVQVSMHIVERGAREQRPKTKGVQQSLAKPNKLKKTLAWVRQYANQGC